MPSGSKLCIPALFGLALLADGPINVNGAPESSDIRDAEQILGGTVRVMDRGRAEIHIHEEALPTLITAHPESRSTLPLLGLLASRRGYVTLPAPKGCGLGPRPIEAHIEILAKFGIEVAFSDESLIAQKRNDPSVSRLRVSRLSSGASVQAILLAVSSAGPRPLTVTNLYPGMEVEFLLNTLHRFGFIAYSRHRSGTYQLVTLPLSDRLKIAAVKVPKDSIELGSWILAALTLGGTLITSSDSSSEFKNLVRVLRRGNVAIGHRQPIQLHCVRGDVSQLGTISTDDGIHTDLIPMLAVLGSQIIPPPEIIDSVFAHRQSQSRLLLRGQFSRRVDVEDIRSGFASMIGAILTHGSAEVHDPRQLLPRGYPRLVEKLEDLGLRVAPLATHQQISEGNQ